MKWTKTPPTKTGWYWERAATVGGHRDRIIHVVKLNDGTCHAVLVAGLKNVAEMSRSFDLCWAGPIPMPIGCASVSDCKDVCKECLEKEWESHGNEPITEITKLVFEETVPCKHMEIFRANGLSVCVGTNGFHGGDGGHGSRAYLEIKDAAGTAWNIEKEENGVSISLCGDSEIETFLQVLHFAVSTLEEQLYAAKIDGGNL